MGPSPQPSRTSPPVYVLDPYKLFLWGFLLGVLFMVGFELTTPYWRHWRAIHDARTEVQVRKILGTCR